MVVFHPGQFPWDRNEVVIVVSNEPDGDRVLARDSRGNQQLIPRTYLSLLSATVGPDQSSNHCTNNQLLVIHLIITHCELHAVK